MFKSYNYTIQIITHLSCAFQNIQYLVNLFFAISWSDLRHFMVSS